MTAAKQIAPDAVYGFRFADDSMAPRYFRHEMAVAHAGRDVIEGDFALIRLKPGQQCPLGTVFVARVTRRSGGSLDLRQFKPDRTIAIVEEQVDTIHQLLSYRDFGEVLQGVRPVIRDVFGQKAGPAMTAAEWIAAADRAGMEPVVLYASNGRRSLSLREDPEKERVHGRPPLLEGTAFKDVCDLLQRQGRTIPSKAVT